jgi:hypothetical protein
MNNPNCVNMMCLPNWAMALICRLGSGIKSLGFEAHQQEIIRNGAWYCIPQLQTCGNHFKNILFSKMP